jgi:hypothetical protein
MFYIKRCRNTALNRIRRCERKLIVDRLNLQPGVTSPLGSTNYQPARDKLATHTMRHNDRSWLDVLDAGISVQQKVMRHLHAELNRRLREGTDIPTCDASTTLNALLRCDTGSGRSDFCPNCQHTYRCGISSQLLDKRTWCAGRKNDHSGFTFVTSSENTSQKRVIGSKCRGFVPVCVVPETVSVNEASLHRGRLSFRQQVCGYPRKISCLLVHQGIVGDS